MTEVESLITLMDEVLRRVIDRYEKEGIPLPDRRYWTLNEPAADCEQLVVSFTQAYIGPPGDEASEPQRCNSPRTAALDIQILRCVPVAAGTRAKAPSAAVIEEASRIQAIDAWLLLDTACSLDTWDPDPDPFRGPGLGVIATVDAGEAQGGFQGVTLHLTTVIP